MNHCISIKSLKKVNIRCSKVQISGIWLKPEKARWSSPYMQWSACGQPSGFWFVIQMKSLLRYEGVSTPFFCPRCVRDPLGLIQLKKLLESPGFKSWWSRKGLACTSPPEQARASVSQDHSVRGIARFGKAFASSDLLSLVLLGWIGLEERANQVCIKTKPNLTVGWVQDRALHCSSPSFAVCFSWLCNYIVPCPPPQLLSKLILYYCTMAQVAAFFWTLFL